MQKQNKMKYIVTFEHDDILKTNQERIKVQKRLIQFYYYTLECYRYQEEPIKGIGKGKTNRCVVLLSLLV